MIRWWASPWKAGCLGEKMGLFGFRVIKKAMMYELEGVVHVYPLIIFIAIRNANFDITMKPVNR